MYQFTWRPSLVLVVQLCYTDRISLRPGRLKIMITSKRTILPSYFLKIKYFDSTLSWLYFLYYVALRECTVSLLPHLKFGIQNDCNKNKFLFELFIINIANSVDNLIFIITCFILNVMISINTCSVDLIYISIKS